MAIEQLKDPKTLGLSFVGGILPALIWLWFWLKEDKENPERFTKNPSSFHAFYNRRNLEHVTS